MPPANSGPIAEAAFLVFLAASARAWIIASDVAQRIPHRLSWRPFRIEVFVGELAHGVIVFSPCQCVDNIFDIAEMRLLKAGNVRGPLFGVGEILLKFVVSSHPFRNPAFVDRAVYQRRELAQPQHGDCPLPAEPGLVLVFGEFFLVERQQQASDPLVRNAPVPRKERRRTENLFADELVDRSIRDRAQ
nr:hypothetical protein [Bradyrhizobium uaiense]